MSSRKCKHDIFAVDCEVVEMVQTQEVQQKRKGKLIDEALETIFDQMRVAGNRQRTKVLEFLKRGFGS